MGIIPSEDLKIILKIIEVTWWVVLPIALYKIFYPMWKKYIIGKYFVETYKPVVLQIKIPKGQEASIKAMENTLAGLWGSIKATVKDVFDEEIEGKVPDYFSLDIASSEGEVGYYVWTSTGMRTLVEKAFYAQFPDIEIVEVEDYTSKVPATVPNENWDMWAGKLLLEKSHFRPLRTYPMFEDSETGNIMDPVANFLEFMGSLGPGEHAWLQIQIAPVGQLDRNKGEEEIQEILEKYNMGGVDYEDPTTFAKIIPHTEMELIKAIDRKISKPNFDCQILYGYIGRKESYTPTTPGSFMGGFIQMESGPLNSFVLDKHYSTSAYYIASNFRKTWKKRVILDLMKDRDIQGETYYLNTEELATLFHFPTVYTKTPSLPRMDSRRASAPHNLPLED